jgi:hypothetical protein
MRVIASDFTAHIAQVHASCVISSSVGGEPELAMEPDFSQDGRSFWKGFQSPSRPACLSPAIQLFDDPWGWFKQPQPSLHGHEGESLRL